MELTIRKFRSKAYPDKLVVGVYGGPTVNKPVEPFYDQASNTLYDTCKLPEFEAWQVVSFPKDLKDYPRYKADVNAAIRRCKARVNQERFRKYPLNFC